MERIKDNFSEQDIIDANIVCKITMNDGNIYEGYFRGMKTRKEVLPTSTFGLDDEYISILDFTGVPKDSVILHIPKDNIAEIKYSVGKEL